MAQDFFQRADASDYAGTAELWANEADLPRYNADLVTLLSRTWRPGQRVLEFGAGIGTLAALWRQHLGEAPDCLEIDRSMRQTLLQRGLQAHADIAEVAPGLDLVYSSNVLEHIEDDVEALRQIRATLKPGGVLAVYVPAMPSVYSEMDRRIGHYRRYQRRELRQKLQAAGFTVERCHFADLIGYFAWGAMKLKGEDSGRQAGGGKLLAIYDRWIYPVSRMLDALGGRHLFGKNLYALARA